MFGSKSLLSCKRAGSLCLFHATKSKSTKNYAVIGVVKYNKENKSLFGDLLETRAQRRKTLKKVNKSLFKTFKKNSSNIIKKNLSSLLKETRFLTLSRNNCKLNDSNYSSFLSKDCQSCTGCTLSFLLSYSKTLPPSISLLLGRIFTNTPNLVNSHVDKPCISFKMSSNNNSSPVIKLKPSDAPINKFFNQKLNHPYRLLTHHPYQSKIKHKILKNVYYKPFVSTRRLIHRQTRVKGHPIQLGKKNIDSDFFNGQVISSHKDSNEFSVEVSKNSPSINSLLLKVGKVSDEQSFAPTSNVVQAHNVQDESEEMKNLEIHLKSMYSFQRFSRKNERGRIYSISKSMEKLGNLLKKEMERSPVASNPINQKRIDSKLITSSTKKNKVSNNYINHNEIETKDLLKINEIDFVNKRKLSSTAGTDQVSDDKKSVHPIFNSKGMHSDSKPQFKHYNFSNAPCKNSIKINGFIERQGNISIAHHFSIENLADKDLEKSTWLKSNGSRSPVERLEKGCKTLAFKISPKLLRRGWSFDKPEDRIETPLNYSKKEKLDNIEKSITKSIGNHRSYVNLSDAKRGDNSITSSKNSSFKISHLLKDKSLKHKRKNDSTLHLEQYFQNMRDLYVSKSTPNKGNFSNQSPPVNNNGKDSDSLQENRNRMYFSFWSDKSKTDRFAEIEQTNLQRNITNEGYINSLLFPRKYNRSTYSSKYNDRKFKLKEHNNALKASNGPSFKLDTYNAVGGKDPMKLDKVFPKPDFRTFFDNCNKVGMNKNRLLVDGGNHNNESEFPHNQERKSIQISDILSQHFLVNTPCLKKSNDKCQVDNPEMSQDKHSAIEEETGGKTESERNLSNPLNIFHSREKDEKCNKNPKLDVTKNKHQSTIHCNDLKLTEELMKNPEPILKSEDLNENVNKLEITDDKNCYYATNHKSDLKSTSLPVDDSFKHIANLKMTDNSKFHTDTKKYFDKIFFKSKAKKQHSNSGRNLPKLIINEKLPTTFEHLLSDSNYSSNSSITEKHEENLGKLTSDARNNKSPILYNVSDELQNNSRQLKNTKNTNSYRPKHLFSLDHKMSSSSNHSGNTFHPVISKSNTNYIVDNKGGIPVHNMPNYISSKQEPEKIQEKPIINGSKNQSNHLNVFSFEKLQITPNRKCDVENAVSNPTNFQSPSPENIKIVSQSSENLMSCKEDLQIRNKVSEKHSDIIETSKLCNTPYYPTLNSLNSDTGNDTSISQYSICESLNANRPYSKFDRTPYYHSVEENNLSNGSVGKYSYCSTSGSTKKNSPIENHCISNGFFGFFHRQFDESKSKPDSPEMIQSTSKLERVKCTLDNDTHVKSSENVSYVEKVKLVNRLDTLVQEKQSITYDLKAIIDFCFSLNIPPKRVDAPTKLCGDLVEFSDKVRKIEDEISLNTMKTIIEILPLPRSNPENHNHLNSINSKGMLNQSIPCPQYQNDESVKNCIDFLPGSSYKITNLSGTNDIQSFSSNMISSPKGFPFIEDKKYGYSECGQIESSMNSFDLKIGESKTTSPQLDNNSNVLIESSMNSSDLKIGESKTTSTQLDNNSNGLIDLNTQRNHLKLIESNVKNPEIVVNSRNVPQNVNISIGSNSGVLLDCGLYKCPDISKNKNDSLLFSSNITHEPDQEVEKYQDSFTFLKNYTFGNDEVRDCSNLINESLTPTSNKYINEDDLHSATPSWNISDRIKYFKLASTLDNAKNLLTETSDELNHSGESEYLHYRKSLTDREKFLDFSNFLKEAVIKRENIFKSIAPFKRKSSSFESDTLLYLVSPESQDYSINSNFREIDLCSYTYSNEYSNEVKEVTPKLSNVVYGIDSNPEMGNNECITKLEYMDNDSFHFSDTSDIVKNNDNFDSHVPKNQIIQSNSFTFNDSTTSCNTSSPSDNVSEARNQKSDCMSILRTGTGVSNSKFEGNPQSDLNLNSNTAPNSELDKISLLLRHSKTTDTKMKFFNSLKLSSCRPICNKSVKSGKISKHAQYCNYSNCCSNAPGHIKTLVNIGDNFNPIANAQHSSNESLSSVSNNKKIVFPEVLEDCCVFQEHEAATSDEKRHLKDKSGEPLGETIIKSALKTSRKQKINSKSTKNSVSGESSSTAAKANDVGQLLGIGSGDSCVKSTEKSSESLNPVEVNVQNSKIDDNIIGKLAEVPQVTSLFPLINVNKSQLKYEDCVEPVINISYESLCKNVISSLPSVGKILSETMPAAAKAALERWKKNMIDQLGEEGFQKLNKENLGRGKLFHDYVSRYLVGETFDHELPEKVQHYFKSLAAVFPHISEVKVVESHVAHPELNYCGFIDCVAKYNGTPVVIEWKLAEKPKPDIRSTYDAPLQMCAYLGALNYDNNYNFPVASGVVVAAYTDGSPANVFYLPEQKCLKYWESFQIRLQEYQKLKSVKLK